jgi:hypothetical protein
MSNCVDWEKIVVPCWAVTILTDAIGAIRRNSFQKCALSYNKILYSGTLQTTISFVFRTK